MPSDSSHPCEVVAIFQSPEDFENAIDELLSSGFDRAELSLLASREAASEKLDHRYRAASEMEDDPSVARAAFVSSAAIGDAKGGLIGGLAYVGATLAAGVVVVGGGALAATIGAAVVAGGAGGLAGSVLARWLGDHHATYLERQIENGGLLLWVRAWTAEDEARATRILGKHSADDIHSHGAFLAAA
jgi:hypothetical protein